MSKAGIKEFIHDLTTNVHDVVVDKKPQKTGASGHSHQPDRLRNETVTEDFTYQPLPTSGRRWMRILRLLPGSRQDDICCQLTAVNLDDCVGTYEALSYVWNPKGYPKETTPIQVNDKTLRVGANLRSALFYLRMEIDKPRTLWVDAICIDQSSIPERNRQVAFMGDIYRSSQRVVVWMGKDTAMTPTAFRIMRELASEAETRRAELAAHVDNDDIMTVASSYVRKGIESPLAAKHESDGSILHLGWDDWWQRAWTIQELLLAPDAIVMKGTFSVPWETLTMGVNYGLAIGLWNPTTLGMMMIPIITPYASLWAMRRRRERLLRDVSLTEPHKGQSDTQQLLDALVQCRFRDATDARDKVFGILQIPVTGVENLGSIPQQSTYDIIPDYVASVRSVYCHTARQLIIHSGSLDVLGSCTSRVNEELQLPTWVPDWSFRRTVALPLAKDAFNQVRRTHASCGTKAEVTFEGDDGGDTLVIHGHDVTTITSLTRTMGRLIVVHGDEAEVPYEHRQRAGGSRGPKFTDRFKRLSMELMSVYSAYEFLMSIVPQLGKWADWDAFARAETPRNPGGAVNGDGDPLTVYWQTLSTGTFLPLQGKGKGKDEVTEEGEEERQRRRATAEAFYSWRASLKAIRGLHRWGIDRLARPLTFVGYIKATWNRYSDFVRLLENTYERRLARCENGYLALVPARAEVGDRIVLAKGGTVPLLLRSATGSAQSKLVGEAYVHGIMDGEVFDEARCEVIRIR
ncbi:heterokaryon incompatibility protein-domain-containing protein [Nemania sp. FL0916]|nr:heterokaryon incompatibility protein-domain-containing protein [Nemania sp. FL0916]